jgi:hypothetical protein
VLTGISTDFVVSISLGGRRRNTTTSGCLAQTRGPNETSDARRARI